jgi:hypothetical protein
MLAGRLLQRRGRGLQWRRVRPAAGAPAARATTCSELVLAPHPGARRDRARRGAARPGAGDAGRRRYRHLQVKDGKLAWQRWRRARPAGRRAAPRWRWPTATARRCGSRKRRADRGGAPPAWPRCWACTPACQQRGRHAGAPAGPGGGATQARLTLDLACSAPPGGARLHRHAPRRSGMAALQRRRRPPAGARPAWCCSTPASGDILAAAGAGNGRVDPPTGTRCATSTASTRPRSPLRLPAFQHDGGAERSPGSTFKIVSALGLELAAQRDRARRACSQGCRWPRSMRWRPRAATPSAPTRRLSAMAAARASPISATRHLDRRAQDGRWAWPRR